MGFEVNWLIPERVIGIEASGTITEADLMWLNDVLYDSMQEQSLHIVYDASAVQKPFLDLERRAQLLPALTDERMGWMVIVNTVSPVLHFLTTSFASKIKRPIAGATNIEEAMATLSHLDATLATSIEDIA